MLGLICVRDVYAFTCYVFSLTLSVLVTSKSEFDSFFEKIT